MPSVSHHIRRRSPAADAAVDWRERAACAGHDPEVFFPPDRPGSPLYEAQTAAAKRVCAACPAVDACLAWAESTGDSHAILGGTTPAERRRQRAAASIPAAAPGSGPGVRNRRAEAVARLAALGMRDDEIARLLGVQRKSVCQLRSNHRIPAGAKQRRTEQEVLTWSTT